MCPLVLLKSSDEIPQYMLQSICEAGKHLFLYCLSKVNSCERGIAEYFILKMHPLKRKSRGLLGLVTKVVIQDVYREREEIYLTELYFQIFTLKS
jgi:hypothetical protein